MISAREGDTIFLKLSDNENLNDLQNLLENYEITSGTIRGFGALKAIEAPNQIFEGGDVILEGIISEFGGQPRADILCYSAKTVSRIKNFVANNLILTIQRFDQIGLVSRKNEGGQIQLSISGKEIHLPPQKVPVKTDVATQPPKEKPDEAPKTEEQTSVPELQKDQANTKVEERKAEAGEEQPTDANKEKPKIELKPKQKAEEAKTEEESPEKKQQNDGKDPVLGF